MVPVRMKALRSFGFPGSSEGKVRVGREFSVRDLRRAKELEEHGLAYRVDSPHQLDRRLEAAPAKNEAAEEGPFASPGGRTGDLPPGALDLEAPAPSSHQDHPQQQHQSTKSQGRSRSSRSRRTTASVPPQK